jgi:hypothetical protein
MPTFDSDEYAAYVADPSLGVNVNAWGGRVRARYAMSPGVVGLADADLVRLFPIYKGERPLFFAVKGETNTASLTLDIGLEDGAGDKYVAALAITTAASVLVGSLSQVPETADGVVAALFDDANPSDTANLEVTMFYVRD